MSHLHTPLPVRLLPLMMTTFVALNFFAEALAQDDGLTDRERFNRDLRMVEELLRTPPEPTYPASTGMFAKAKQFQIELDSQNSAYLRSQDKLRTTLQEAIGRIPGNMMETDFHYEREALDALKSRAGGLAREAQTIIQNIDAHRTVGRNYVVALSKAPPTYEDLAQQFRQFAQEEAYSDRREDYLAFASIFDGLARRYRGAASQIQPDMKAIDELYPYLQSTELMLTRMYSALDLLPSESYGRGGPRIEAQLRKFVQSFNGFRGAIRKLNERLGGDSENPITPTPSGESDRITQRTRTGYSSTPIKSPESLNSLASLRKDASRKESAFPSSSRHQPSGGTTLRPAPSAWIAAESVAERNVLVFHLTGNDSLRREVLRPVVREGEVYTVQLHTGRRIALRVRRLMPTLGTRSVQFWLAEPTNASPSVAAELVAYRP